MIVKNTPWGDLEWEGELLEETMIYASGGSAPLHTFVSMTNGMILEYLPRGD